MNKRDDNNTEVWICNSEIFSSENVSNQIKYKEKRKWRHYKGKFYLIPVIAFFLVATMFGKGKVYEDKQTISYVVVPGDTLWDISRRYLGKGYRYLQIAIENDMDDPDLIYAGEEYRITVIRKFRVWD